MQVVIEVEGPQRHSIYLDELSAEDAPAKDAQGQTMLLTAGELRADLRECKLTATGRPRLTYGSSSYEGQAITVQLQEPDET